MHALGACLAWDGSESSGKADLRRKLSQGVGISQHQTHEDRNKHAQLAPVVGGWDKSYCGKSLTVPVTLERGSRLLLSRAGRVAAK